MDERRSRIGLALIAATMIAIAIVYAIERPKGEPGPMPDDPVAIARRLASHPSDWEAASALLEHALDANVPDRFALWRAARDTAFELAPNRDVPRVALARGVFFHWTEMNAADRRAAIDAIAPLLRDQTMFVRMAEPLYDLTGDLSILRRWQPGTEQSTEGLMDIAAKNGDFKDFRELRRELIAKEYADLTAKLPRVSPAEIIEAMPQPPYTNEQQPLLQAVLDELHRRPLDEDPHRGVVLDALIDYALRHQLLPLDGLELVTQVPAASESTRIALADALGLSKRAFQIRMTATTPIETPKAEVWQEAGASRWMLHAFRGPASITLERAAGDEVPPYVSILVDDVRVAEGEVRNARTFAVPAGAGMHRIEVRVENPLTRNNQARRVRVVTFGP